MAPYPRLQALGARWTGEALEVDLPDGETLHFTADALFRGERRLFRRGDARRVLVIHRDMGDVRQTQVLAPISVTGVLLDFDAATADELARVVELWSTAGPELLAVWGTDAASALLEPRLDDADVESMGGRRTLDGLAFEGSAIQEWVPAVGCLVPPVGLFTFVCAGGDAALVSVWAFLFLVVVPAMSAFAWSTVGARRHFTIDVTDRGLTFSDGLQAPWSSITEVHTNGRWLHVETAEGPRSWDVPARRTELAAVLRDRIRANAESPPDDEARDALRRLVGRERPERA
ncbi:MAG: hypothetical protein KC656_01065 [Myxococcales bacterium]|nr:hypothetical protein [Myxococcales bacterium]MCB9671079.1 hypothetical protein [Alphaproteobacteria bacterium]MCB9692335.1 hypothetical protein [Alphaproteobacteria bacterium]